MGIEAYIPQISLTIVTLIVVYMYDWIFIWSDDFFSSIIRSFLESIINHFKSSKFSFKGFWFNIPSFIYFIITVIIFLPLAINYGVNNLNPILIQFLSKSQIILWLVIGFIFIILYFLFQQFWYKLRKQQKNQRRTNQNY